jgi:UTP--glucose-1-phosphate uridylyltransferase
MVGDEPFVVVLPDVIVDDASSNPKKDNLAEMVAKFNSNGVSQIMVEQGSHEEVRNYSIVDLEGLNLSLGESGKIHGIVEKPSVDEAPSDLAVVGRYVLSDKIWDLLEYTPPGAGDEVQLTDAIATLMKLEQVDAYYMKGKSHDCGTKLGYMKANVEYALRHPELGEQFGEFLKTLNH